LLKHTLGWPLTNEYGGGFLYAMSETQIHLGYIVGLDYKNPYVSPYEEFQRWKTHPSIKKYIENGTCEKYGARVISSGGFYSLPKLTAPGVALTGCSAGMVDFIKIKGAHNAIKSGVILAKEISK
jgi:electron-transferring-flavoprotein dehydrogenase